jgi:hypothetical protein
MTAFGPYPGLVRLVHDGDTVFVDLDLGFGMVVLSRNWDDKPNLSCRIQRRRADGSYIGINAPELSTPTGITSRDYAMYWLRPGDRVRVLSFGWDKYGGRFDGAITLADGTDFGTLMVNNGYAVEKDYS